MQRVVDAGNVFVVATIIFRGTILGNTRGYFLENELGLCPISMTTGTAILWLSDVELTLNFR